MMKTREVFKRIRAIEKSREGKNFTRWYSSVHPKRNGEAEIKTWAVKTYQGKPLIMLASVLPTDGSQPKVSGRCLTSIWDNCPHWNWLDYGGKSHVAVWEDVDGCRNEMLDAYEHKFKRGIEFYGLGTFVNGFENTKYEYGQYFQSGMRVSDWLDCMHISPKTELLIKANLHRWLDPRYLPTLLDNKGLLDYVRSKASDIQGKSPFYVIRDYKKETCANLNDERARAFILCEKYKFSSLVFKPLRILHWLEKYNVKPAQLRHHIDNLKELNIDLDYEPHVLPKDFAVYSLEIEERIHERREAIRLAKEAEAMERARIAREARIYARKLIRRLSEQGKIKKKYSVVIPSSETEMIAEGKAMRNCVGGYWHSGWQQGSCELAFIRKNGKPYIDVEIQNGEIYQARYKGNIAVDTSSKDYKMCEMVASVFTRKAA